MALNYTSNYGLCQWEPSDKVLRSEFNGDNAKIDAAIAAMDGRMDGKASTAALAELKSRLDTLSATVSGQGDALTKKGNCQVVVSTYTGTGEGTRTHTFPRRPAIFFIAGDAQLAIGYGATVAYNHSDSTYAVGVSWSGNSATLVSKSSGASARVIANRTGITYQMITLYDQSV